jgi:membrane-associated protease RseP (regulator of RpoE activity)
VIFTVVRDGETMEIEVTLDMASMMPEVFRPDSDLQIQPVPATRPTQLGVQFQTIDAGVVEEKGLTVEQGALIVEVFEDTPAAGAGLLVDDIILAVDGDVVDEERTLADRLYAYEEGDVVTLTVLRGEEEIGIEVELGPRNVGFGMTTGSIQVMPMQPGQQGFFGYGFGPGMGHHMRPGMEFFFQGQPGGFFEMHPFMDGGFFEFHFGNDHPFWGSKDEAGSAGSGGESGSSADNSDSGESMQQVAPDTSNDTPL